ncbi:MAG TPA: hypothetical protein DCO82_08670 [Alphaproteobacteria bacterium]|nr:hypothetical protein [Alphaproteobacteria bacterium]
MLHQTSSDLPDSMMHNLSNRAQHICLEPYKELKKAQESRRAWKDGAPAWCAVKQKYDKRGGEGKRKD